MLQIDVNLLDGIYQAIQIYPERAKEISHSFKSNQILSKLEVASRIPIGKNVCLLGGWYAIGFMLTHSHPTTKFTSVDKDPQCELIGSLVRAPNYKFITADALRFDTTLFDIIVNCSTEHMDHDQLQFSFANIASGKVCIFQNNNNFGVPDHINCFADATSFRAYISEQFDVDELVTTTMDNGSERYTAVCTKI